MAKPRPKRRAPPRPTIGWREWVALPRLGVPPLKAKVDTGARSSALHAAGIEILEVDGERRVRFKVHPQQRSRKGAIACEAPLLDLRKVRDSGGRQTVRPVIETVVQLDRRIWPIEVTLTARSRMGFRMLLGRQAIRRRFVVDPSRSFLAGVAPTPDDDPKATGTPEGKP